MKNWRRRSRFMCNAALPLYVAAGVPYFERGWRGPLVIQKG